MNDLVMRTPLIRLHGEKKVFLKPENLQIFGSYKIRGVNSAICQASPTVLSKGIKVASAGNMGQAVAFLARQRSIACEVFVPDSAPEIKKQAIKNLGASISELPFEEIWKMVMHRPKHFEGLFVHPVFTPGLLEGYSQIAEELLMDRPTLDAVIIPFGVGGLAVGVGRKLKELKPSIKVYACEPDTAAPLKLSLLTGNAMRTRRFPSFVDAIGTPEVLPEVFSIVSKLVTDSIAVSLKEIEQALAELMKKNKLICEGAAGASLAAAKRLKKENPEMEVACILTGGNISSQVLRELL